MISDSAGFMIRVRELEDYYCVENTAIIITPGQGLYGSLTKHWTDGISGGWNNEYLQLQPPTTFPLSPSQRVWRRGSVDLSVFVIRVDSRTCLRHRFHHYMSHI